jgi:glycosyltransferase involved in cell wall biosynthesis
MPVRDEAPNLEAAVESVLAQEYPGRVELCLAVAPSSDGTERVAAELTSRHPEVCVVPNPAGTTPAGLNAAIRATTAPVVARVDAHAELCAGYLRRAVDTLRRTGAVNVGGIQLAEGTTPFEQAVAAAMSSRFGAGDAKFHYGGAEGPTDTVYLGVFQRPALEAAGGFDESLERNQDYELNIRLRQAGGTVWFDPALVVRYRPRGSLHALARQYFQYGQWKREVLRRHPGSLRWRQAIPPLATSAVAIGLLVAPRWPKALMAPGGYATALLVAAARAGRGQPGRAVRLMAILPTIHFAWSLGLVRGPRTRAEKTAVRQRGGLISRSSGD